jgi:hypothetical protein
MNQSIFVLGALVSAMIFSFAQQRTIVDSELRRVDHYYEARSSKESTRVLDRLETIPFDPAGAVEDPDSLSLEGEAQEVSGLKDLQTLNDASALHYMSFETADSLDMYLSVELRFVEPGPSGSFVASSQPPFFKEVEVTVQPAVSDGPDGVTRSRVLTQVPAP